MAQHPLHPANWPSVPVLLIAWLGTLAAVLIIYTFQPLVALLMVVPLVLWGWFAKRFWSTALMGSAAGLIIFGLAYLTQIPGRTPDATTTIGAAAVSVLFGIAVGVIGHAGRLIHRLQEKTTALREAHAELESSSRYLSAVYEGTSVGLIALDRDGTITSWNPGATSIFGYIPDVALGKPITFLSEDRDRLAPIMHGLELHTEVSGTQTSLLHRDGYLVDVDVRMSPIEGGGAIFAAVDRTREHMMEEAIAEQEEKYEQLLKNLDDTFYALRADTQEMVAVTTAVKDLTGHPPARFQNQQRGWLDMVHPEDRDTVEKAVRHARSGDNARVRWRLRHADGHYLWVEDRIVPTRDEDGRIIRLDGRLRRMDPLVDLEDTLERRQAMLDAIPNVAWFEVREDGWTWGQGAMRLFGLPAATLVEDDSFLDIIHPDDVVPFQDALDMGETRDIRVSIDGHYVLATLRSWTQDDLLDGSLIQYGVLELQPRPVRRLAAREPRATPPRAKAAAGRSRTTILLTEEPLGPPRDDATDEHAAEDDGPEDAPQEPPRRTVHEPVPVEEEPGWVAASRARPDELGAALPKQEEQDAEPGRKRRRWRDRRYKREDDTPATRPDRPSRQPGPAQHEQTGLGPEASAQAPHVMPEPPAPARPATDEPPTKPARDEAPTKPAKDEEARTQPARDEAPAKPATDDAAARPAEPQPVTRGRDAGSKPAAESKPAAQPELPTDPEPQSEPELPAEPEPQGERELPGEPELPAESEPPTPSRPAEGPGTDAGPQPTEGAEAAQASAGTSGPGTGAPDEDGKTSAAKTEGDTASADESAWWYDPPKRGPGGPWALSDEEE